MAGALESAAGDSWTALTRRALDRSIPYDTGRAVLFVRPKGDREDTWESRDATHPLSGGTRKRLTGEEARSFYEEVITSPEEPSTVAMATQPQPRKKRRRNPELGRTMVSNIRRDIGPVSLAKLFQFAQEGDLASLTLTLSSHDSGFHVNVMDQFDWTLLMSAAHAGQRAVVLHLLDAGAEWRGRVDKRGRTAADLARAAGHSNIADDIESHRFQFQHGTEGVGTVRQCNRSRSDRCRSGQHSRAGKTKAVKRVHFCEVCGIDVTENISSSSSSSSHGTSTIHQFSCGHSPAVTNYGIPVSNRGFQMMLREGWDPDGGLGSQKQGRQFPVKTVLKRDRLGIGVAPSEPLRPRVTHFSPHDRASVKGPWERERGRGREVGRKAGGKRERRREVERERRWEMAMRRCLNSDS